MSAKSNHLAAFLSVLIIFSLYASDEVTAATSGKVTVAVGNVKVMPPGGTETELKVGDVVAIGSKVITGVDSRAVIVMTRQSAVRVGPESEVTVDTMVDDATNPKVLLDLKRGSMGALIDKEAATKMDFQIKTPSGVSAARGTFFSVAVENGRGFIKVKEGVVEIRPTVPQPGAQ